MIHWTSWDLSHNVHLGTQVFLCRAIFWRRMIIPLETWSIAISLLFWSLPVFTRLATLVGCATMSGKIRLRCKCRHTTSKVRRYCIRAVITYHSESPQFPGQANGFAGGALFPRISVLGRRKASPKYPLELMPCSIGEGPTFSSGKSIGGGDGAGSCGGIWFSGMIGGKVWSSLNPTVVSFGLTVVIVSCSGKSWSNGVKDPKSGPPLESPTTSFAMGTLDSWPDSERKDPSPFWLDSLVQWLLEGR
jgi:hypothetical protein